MPTQQQIEDDVLFWLGQQEKEHMGFLVLGLQDPVLKAEAAKLLRGYEEASNRRDIRGLLALASSSQALKKAAFQAASERWIGWLYPSLYEHMIEEIDYALARTRRELSPREVSCFWAKERSGVAAIVAKLLDPQESFMTRNAMMHHVVLRNLHTACRKPSSGNLSPIVFRESDMLDRMILGSPELAKAKGILHPILIQHERIEGARAKTDLQNANLAPT